MAEQNFPAKDAVRLEEIKENAGTLANIRLWDYRPLRDSYNQLQSIRPTTPSATWTSTATPWTGTTAR